MLNESVQGFHKQSWSQAVSELENNNSDYVLVTVLAIAGSVPRENGTKMVVTETEMYDTIGGGHLEFKVIEHARTLLANQSSAVQELKHFRLAANLGQCCGGTVTLLFEYFCCTQPVVQLYGAGHIAHALVPILAQLPLKIQWIDARKDLFPEQLPANVSVFSEPYPEDAIANAPAGSYFLILTHNHQLDFLLSERILKRSDAHFVGLIGSKTKAKRFRMRLAHRNFSKNAIDQLQCPVGLADVGGKLPMEVAVSIAAAVIVDYQNKNKNQKSSNPEPRRGVSWQQLKPLLASEKV